MANQGDSVPATKAFSRLPTNVVPSQYHLNIRPDIANFTFTGSEKIEVEVKEATKTIVLNSLDIDIQSVTFISKGLGKSCLVFLLFYCCLVAFSLSLSLCTAPEQN
jgi:aminopeptidase N